MAMLIKTQLLLMVAVVAQAAKMSTIEKSKDSLAISRNLAELTAGIAGGQGASAAGADGEGVQALTVSVDKHQRKHERYKQTFRNKEVVGAGFVVHKQAGGERIARVSGIVAEGVTQDLADVDLDACPPAANVAEAKRLTRSSFFPGQSRGSVKLGKTDVQTVVHIHEQKAVVAHRIGVWADTATSVAKGAFIMDACSGVVYKQWNDMRSAVGLNGTGPGGNESPLVGMHRYDEGDMGKMLVTQTGDVCSMDNEWLRVVDCLKKKKCWKRQWRNPFEFACFESDGSDARWGGFSPNNDVLFYGTKLFNMFHDWYGEDPFQANKVTLYTHYKKKFFNAFWDGLEGAFGDGNKKEAYPLTCPDTVAHEMCHGITQLNSDLIYDAESGGNNEAFSDICGKAIEFYLFGEIQHGWTQGLCETKTGEPLRCMDNPPCDGHSIDHANEFSNGVGVHSSSGVLNKAFYTLATSPGWDTRLAFDLFYCANKQEWVPSSDFTHAAQGVLACAVDDAVQDTQAIVDAFAVVGVTIAV